MIAFVVVFLVLSLSAADAGRVTSARPKINGELTALDEYVWKYDDNYDWVEMKEYGWKSDVQNRGYTAHVLNMTSQRWLTDSEFTPDSDSKSIWWHYLVVLVPDELKYTKNASLWITGGSVTSGPPTSSDEDIIVSAALATSTHTVVGALFQIPNEHVTFSSDPILKSRSEDAIIAFTWDRLLKDQSDPTWLVRFPMVKASLRAMDSVTDFMKTTYPEKETSLDYYVVSGASKRGWTTWLVGAVDPERVVAIIPIVLDAINFVTVEHHQFRSYGGWTYALQDYIDENITERFDNPAMLNIQHLEDPYFYKDRLTMPKLVVNAVYDEFQQPDDTSYWWSDMPGPKHFMIAPNTEHSCATGILEIVPGVSAWIEQLLTETAIPTFDWTINDSTGEITATLDDIGKIHEVSLWYAYSCGVNNWDNGKLRRDYRVAHLDSPCTCGPFIDGYCTNIASVWTQKTLNPKIVNGKRTYTAKMDAPNDGRWVAFFIDLKYENPHADDTTTLDVQKLSKQVEKKRFDEKPWKQAFIKAIEANKGHKTEDLGLFPHDLKRYLEFTTQVSVWPQTFPYEDCSGVSCGDRIL